MWLQVGVLLNMATMHQAADIEDILMPTMHVPTRAYGELGGEVGGGLGGGLGGLCVRHESCGCYPRNC